MRTVFFREDDYRLKELLPLSATGGFLDEIYKNETFNLVRADKICSDDMYKDDEAAKALGKLGITSRKLKDALFFLPVFDKVETDSDNFRSECKHINAMGANEGTAVYWSENGGGFVDALWLKLKSEDSREETKKILTALGKLANVILADRQFDCCVDLRSETDIDDYLNLINF